VAPLVFLAESTVRERFEKGSKLCAGDSDPCILTTSKGVALWRLNVHGAAIDGRSVISDGEFKLVEPDFR
jgi:hypothetical protein